MNSWKRNEPADDSYAREKFGIFQRSGNPRDLDAAVKDIKRILRELPENHPDQNGLKYNLSIFLQTRSDCFRDHDALDEALQVMKIAADNTPFGHPNFLLYKHGYANVLRKRFLERKEIADLEEAVKAAREVVMRTAEGSPRAAEHIRMLSVTLAIRFETLGDRLDLTEGIELGEKALALTPESNPERATMIHNLANMYENLFNADGSAEEERRAIDAAEAAVIATSEDNPRRTEHLKLLGLNLWRRYERTGRAEDLERAIECLEQATVPNKCPEQELASRLNTLSAMLFTRYQRLGDKQDSKADLGRAIIGLEDALELASENGGDLTMYKTNLSALLVERFKMSNDEEDLNKAIQYGEASLERVDPSHYNNLGIVLERRYLRTRNRQDLIKAIEYAINSVSSTPANHRDLSGRLNNLGHRLLLDSPKRKGNALDQFIRSWNNSRGTPLHRVDAARQSLQLLAESNRWEEASIISKEAVGLLTLMNNRTLSREDQEIVASKFAGLVSDACSISLHTGEDAAEALKLLEQGRGSIMGLLVDDRSDITQLEIDHPQLARKYHSLRLEVNRSSEQSLSLDSAKKRVGERIDLVANLTSCINNIRKIPGYSQFLLGQTSEQMMKLADEGPIVVVNVTDFRSDAIVVSPTAITALELPKVKASWVKEWSMLNQDKSIEPLTKANRHREFLIQLWSTCVETILQNLKTRKDSKGKPVTRVWWIGTGFACSLPFHAAGYHNRGSSKNAASQVISSYTTTLKALAYARLRSQHISLRRPAKQTPNLMVAIMPETPGQNPLPGTVEEMEVVLKTTESATTNIGLIQPTAATVLSHLEKCEIVHFACHGISETASPLSSYLALYDSSNQEDKVDKLTVDQICKARLENVQMAYLSACSTAENKVQALNDEAIHLASGFQVAGFSHVIASMWSADDQACVDVARRFYENLAFESNALASDEAIAVALHRSVEAIRTNNTLKWGPFIHIGA